MKGQKRGLQVGLGSKKHTEAGLQERCVFHPIRAFSDDFCRDLVEHARFSQVSERKTSLAVTLAPPPEIVILCKYVSVCLRHRIAKRTEHRAFECDCQK